MSRLHELPPDQSAALSLLLRSRRSHGEVAQMLGIDPPAVHDRAHAALTVLAPRLARHLDAQERERIGEYLLGQLPAPQADGVRLELAASAPAQEWAAALAGELSEIAGASLPPIPEVAPGAQAQSTPQAQTARSGQSSRPQQAAHTEQASHPQQASHPEQAAHSEQPSAPPRAAEPGQWNAQEPHGSPKEGQRGAQLAERVSRRGGALLLAGLLAAVIAVVIVLVTSGGGGGNAGTLASSNSAASTSSGEGHAAHGGLGRTGSAGASARRHKHGARGSAGARRGAGKGVGKGAGREGATSEAGGTEAGSAGEAQAGAGGEARSGSGESATGAAGAGSSEPEPKVEGQIILTPSESGSAAKGVLVLASEGGNRGMLLSAERLQPTEGFTYVLWLISGQPNVKPLAFEAPAVSATGKDKEAMLAGRPLPEDPSAYDRVELTKETVKHPTRPSAEVVLSGEFKAG